MKDIELVEIDLAKERMKFSSGHFTIFSAKDRERIHGHDFRVAVTFTTEVGPNGMAFDYGILKDIVTNICDSLDEYFLLPSNSPHLKIEQSDGEVRAIFGGEILRFVAQDVRLLPIRNTTVEDLSGWILTAIRNGLSADIAPLVHAITVRVSSGPGQGAAISWRA
jgi:6-pyruvoyltetrahydropterin/6-carboxytetrahydropterin synthase